MILKIWWNLESLLYFRPMFYEYFILSMDLINNTIYRFFDVYCFHKKKSRTLLAVL